MNVRFAHEECSEAASWLFGELAFWNFGILADWNSALRGIEIKDFWWMFASLTRNARVLAKQAMNAIVLRGIFAVANDECSLRSRRMQRSCEKNKMLKSQFPKLLIWFFLSIYYCSIIFHKFLCLCMFLHVKVLTL